MYTKYIGLTGKRTDTLPTKKKKMQRESKILTLLYMYLRYLSLAGTYRVLLLLTIVTYYSLLLIITMIVLVDVKAAIIVLGDV